MQPGHQPLKLIVKPIEIPRKAAQLGGVYGCFSHMPDCIAWKWIRPPPNGAESGEIRYDHGVLIGDKNHFAAEIGESEADTTQLRRVDLWAAGHWLTCDDNTAYVPTFCTDVYFTLRRIRSGSELSLPFHGVSPEETHRRLLEVDDGTREQFWFPCWGPTTDNIVGHIFRVGKKLVITFEFWRDTHLVPKERGMVFKAELPQAEFVDVLDRMLAALNFDTRPLDRHLRFR
jgi:hypothetical protein